MPEPASMWREELIHPLVVHFPVALLIFGTLFWITGLFWHKRFPFLRPAGRLMLLIGTIGAWTAVYTGNLADGEVARTLCDPTVAKDHQRFAYMVGYLFSAFIVIEWIFTKGFLPFINTRLVKSALAILLIAGCGFLGYVGHLGGKLVYQQSAAVYQPTEGCAEFE